MDLPSHKKPTGDAHKPQPPSTSNLVSSAKVVADAAKASLRHESGKVDKGRMAGAAADLLGAASRYGKLEEKNLGKYVGKAENYLHKYQSSHSTTTTSSSSPAAAHPSSAPSGGGYGQYVKMAEGFLKKH